MAKILIFLQLIDCFASFPLTLVEIASSGEIEGGQANKLLRSLKILKLFRILRIPRLYKALERKKLVSPTSIRLFKLILTYVIILHYMACGYWYVSQIEGFCIFQDSSGEPCAPEYGSSACDVSRNASLRAYYAWNGGDEFTSALDASKVQTLSLTKNGYFECADAWTPWAPRGRHEGV